MFLNQQGASLHKSDGYERGSKPACAFCSAGRKEGLATPTDFGRQVGKRRKDPCGSFGITGMAEWEFSFRKGFVHPPQLICQQKPAWRLVNWDQRMRPLRSGTFASF